MEFSFLVSFFMCSSPFVPYFGASLITLDLLGENYGTNRSEESQKRDRALSFHRSALIRSQQHGNQFQERG
jgi:hypothetical protein